MKFYLSHLRTLSIALAIAASLVPAFAFAQQYTNCGTQWQNWGSTNCTPGNLLVYVQVNNNNGSTLVPSNFTVTVNAPTASPSSFTGSLQGTPVLVGGSYSVTVLQPQGYSATYSTGCTGNLSQNASGACIVTESNTSQYNNYPYTYYPNQYYPTNSYPYNTGYSIPLTCTPSGQTVTVGQNITFTAQGGDFSQYNWYSSAQPNNVSYNIGRTYTTTLLSPGTQNITVTNGQQTALCSVTVVGYPVSGYNYQTNYPTYSTGVISPVSTLYPSNVYAPVTVTPTYIPSLPNTGFAPIDGATLATVLALLFAAALATYPYVRKAFATVLG